MTRVRLALLCAGVFLFFGLQVSASIEDVSFPIAELGSCDSQEACFAYCDEAEHYDACMSFAEANDLLPEEDIEKYQDMRSSIENGGPGGCTDQTSCDAYCSDVSNLEECLTFATENGMMGEEELAEAQKVLAAIQSGVSLPGGCTSEEACDAYCQELEHMQECMDFATAAGMMSEEDAAQAQKVLTVMQSGGSPGGCVSKDECDAYCSDPTHMEECIDFAVETGFMTAEEAEKIKAEGSLGIKRDDGEDLDGENDGKKKEGEFEFDDSFSGPGGCASEQECMSYCSDPANSEECASFFGGEQRIDEFDEDHFEDDDIKQFDTEDRIMEEDDVPEGEWVAPPEFHEQDRIEDEFEFNDEPSDEGDQYEYEGDDFEDDDFHFDDEGPEFEEFDSQDIPLDLGGREEGDEQNNIDVNPDSGSFDSGGSEFNGGDQGGDQGGGDSSGDSGSQGGGDSQGAPSADAGLMKSVKQFLSRAVSLLML